MVAISQAFSMEGVGCLWVKLIGDVPAATAILDRFLHHAEVVTITGKSYRLKTKAGKEVAAPERINKEPEKKSKNQPPDSCPEEGP